MIRRLLSLALITGMLSSCGQVSLAPFASHPSGLSSQKLRFEIPKATRWTLSNGLEVVYYHSDEVPKVKGKLIVLGGGIL